MKPFNEFKYPVCIETMKLQNMMHWLPTETHMENDLIAYEKLNPSMKSLVTAILTFFVHSDVEISSTYGRLYPEIFNSEYPEIQMMLSAIANAEAIHVWAYSHLIETLNLPLDTYKGFQEYEAGHKRLQALSNILNTKTYNRVGLTVLFYEGVMLYGMFALLMSLQFDHEFSGLTTLVSWSIRDENLHVTKMSELLNCVMTLDEKDDFQDNIIDFIPQFKATEKLWLPELIAGLTDLSPKVQFVIDHMDEYIEFLIEYRINTFFGATVTKQNPLTFLDDMHKYQLTDFLKGTETEYTKVVIPTTAYDSLL